MKTPYLDHARRLIALDEAAKAFDGFPAFAKLRLSTRTRLANAVWHLQKYKCLNRVDIMDMGEVSMPQASKDIQTIMEFCPGLMVYDKSRKCYVLREAVT